MKIYSYEINYKHNGELKREYLYTEMQAVIRYINILTDNNFNCSELKIFRNAMDITEQVNKFLMK